MKPIDQMDSDALNREIARLRGELQTSCDLSLYDIWMGLPDFMIQEEVYPNYLLWANAGKLLEEMVTNWGWEYAAWLVAKAAHKDDGTDYAPPDAIRHAYYEWKRGKDADTE